MRALNYISELYHIVTHHSSSSSQLSSDPPFAFISGFRLGHVKDDGWATGPTYSQISFLLIFFFSLIHHIHLVRFILLNLIVWNIWYLTCWEPSACLCHFLLRIIASVLCPWLAMWALTASRISLSTSPSARASASISSASVPCHKC